MSIALDIREVSASRGDTQILKSVSLHVLAGEIVALMGTSGAGKTTLLRAVAALGPIDSGRIAVDGFELTPGAVPAESKLRVLRRSVGMVSQSQSLFEHLTVMDNVTLALVHALGWTRERAEAEALALLTTLGVSHRAAAFPRQLSGGEAQRVAIARALAPDPLVLLLDEPTSALDPARRASLGEVLRELAREGHALLISTHDVAFAEGFADRVAVLSKGEIVQEGEPRDVLPSSAHPDTRALFGTSSSPPGP